MTTIEMKSIEDTIKEGRDLVESGDLDLQMYRGWYKQTYDTDTTLTEDELIYTLMSADDDMDPSDWVKLIKTAEDAKAAAS